MAARIHSQRRLIDLLAETGPLAPAQAQALLGSLAAEAAALLADGRPAEQVCIANIWVDDSWQPVFASSDAQMDVLEATTRTKQKVESGAGQERAMVFQLGCIACELLTGETADAYLVSPRVKRQVPGAWRPIVDSMLGYDPATRLTTLKELHAAMSSLLEPQNSAETPRHGTGVDVTGNTPLAALPAARRSPEQVAEPLPFTILGHYRVEAKIGSGGMGDVYRGFDPALERTVALKVLPAELARQQDFVRRFEDEAKAAARLVHPNIVQIYFIGEDAGRHFFAMQYVAGESLASRLAREKRLPTADALALVEQLLEGLSVAHTRGMIHRDIKPSNILLDGEQGRALLADFGLVKSLDGGTQLTATGMVMGTVDYLSPEQGRGLPVDARSDLYSVGVLLYQLLSGRLPFESNSATAMIFQHAYERPRLLTDVAPSVPEGVSRLVHRLLEKDPRDRYASAEDLLVDVRGLRASPDFEAPPRANENPSAASSWLLSDVDDQLTTPFPPIPLPGWRDRWRLLLHRRAPRLLQRLQNTEQQMDGAIAVYQARRDQLSQLADEAAAVTRQLAADLEDQRRAGDGSSAGELEQMLAEHQAQLDDLRLRKAQADAALEKLRNQQAVLRARLQVATAGQALAGAGDRPRAANWRRAKSWLLAAAVAAVLVILLTWDPRLEDPATPLAVSHPPTAPIVSSWIDLLSTVQLPEDILGGNWKQVPDGLKIDNPSGAQRLQLPVQINGSYDLRFQFTRGNGAPNRGLSVSLPVGNRRVNVVIGQVNGHGVGIAGINRFTAFHNDNPAADKRVDVLPDVRHDALVSVRLDGALAKIAVALDDVQRVEWSGQQSELNLPASMDSALSDVPILAAWGNDVTFHHIDLRMIDGKATLIRGGEAPLAADLLEPRQPQAPSPLEGYFHVACKGAFELLINGRPVFANTEQKPFAGTSDRVTLKQGDVVSVRFNSKYVYRAIRLAFVDVNRKWLWSAQREDFRVTKDVDPAEVSAELIASSNLLPDFGRVDWDSGSVDGWDLLIENDTSDWLWAGGKNVWAMYSAVVRPELFAPYKIVIPTHRSRWEPPQNAGAAVNSSADDAGPFLAADGKALLFHSNRDGGRGDFDLYISRRDSVDQAWQTPEPLGEPLNTPAADCFRAYRPTG